VGAYLVLLTLHGEIVFNEYTICQNKNRTVKDATLIHAMGSTTHTCKFRPGGSDDSLTKGLFPDADTLAHKLTLTKVQQIPIHEIKIDI